MSKSKQLIQQINTGLSCNIAQRLQLCVRFGNIFKQSCILSEQLFFPPLSVPRSSVGAAPSQAAALKFRSQADRFLWPTQTPGHDLDKMGLQGPEPRYFAHEHCRDAGRAGGKKAQTIKIIKKI